MSRWVVDVDVQERSSDLYQAVSRRSTFDVRVRKLAVGDYSLGGRILVERKSRPDFVRSLLDGRLFPQAARLARASRGVFLLERYGAGSMPYAHPHALVGAVVSLAVIWRLPVIVTSTVDESVAALEALARQSLRVGHSALRRFDFKPKRLESRKLHFLQGLPGIGPALALRLLQRFGTPAKIVAASSQELMQVSRIGAAKAAAIRAVLD